MSENFVVGRLLGDGRKRRDERSKDMMIQHSDQSIAICFC